jgi:hypothetical protein
MQYIGRHAKPMLSRAFCPYSIFSSRTISFVFLACTQ